MSTPADHEWRAHAEHHASLRLWLRLLSCTILVEDRVRQKLRDNFDTTLPRFDLMAQLERHPEGLSMGELSRRMMVTGGNITAVVDQLEKEQLVQRQTNPTDRRSITVLLTAPGRAAFMAMATEHEKWVVALFGDVPAEQQQQLLSLLGTLKTSLHNQATPTLHGLPLAPTPAFLRST